MDASTPSPAPSDTRRKIPVSVLVVIHTPALEVLLIERAQQPGFWQSVTGSIDTLGEPLVATAAREVAEETGIQVGSAAVPAAALRDWQLANVYEIYPLWRHRYPAGVWKNTEHVFSLEVPAGTPVTLAERCFSASNGDAIRQLPRRIRPR